MKLGGKLDEELKQKEAQVVIQKVFSPLHQTSEFVPSGRKLTVISP